MRKAERTGPPTLSADTLRALLAARSVRIAGPAARRAGPVVRAHPPCMVTSRRGIVDIEVLLDASATRRSPARVRMLVASPRRPLPWASFGATPLIGPGAALWTPALQIGVFGPTSASGREGPQRLLVTQGRTAASLLVDLAARHAVRLSAALCTGLDHGVAWDDVLVAAAAQDRAPSILLALHRPIESARLLRSALACQDVILLPLGAARTVTPNATKKTREQPPRLPPIDVAQLAASLGWVVVDTPEQMIAAAALSPLGARRRTNRALALADDEAGATLLENVLAHAGIPCTRTVPRRDEQRALATRRPRFFLRISPGKPAAGVLDADLVLAASQSATPPAKRRQGLSPLLYLKQLAPLDAGIAALGAMLATPAGQQISAARPHPSHRSSFKRASALLDRCPPFLLDHHVVELLSCFALPVAGGHLVHSASAAGVAANSIGAPALLRVLGGSRPAPPRGLAIEHVPTAAAARQAFHDLVARPSRAAPGAITSAHRVWVTRQPPADLALECAILSAAHRPLLAASKREPATRLIARCCPLEGDEAERLAWQVLGDEEPFRGAAHRVARLFAALSRIACDLGDQLCWLRLDRVAMGRRPALLVVEGFGAQRQR